MPPRKDKKPKDINAPKRAPSAYILFNQDRQKTLREQHADKKLTEITKMIGAEWRTLDETSKKRFQDEATERKKKADEEMAAYKKTDLCRQFEKKLSDWKKRQKNPGGGSDDDDDDDEGSASDGGNDSDAPPKPGNKPKDANAPKKPLTAFFMFQTSRREQLKADNPDKKITEITKLAGAEWKELSEDQKKEWSDKAKVKKEAYDERLAAYKETDEYADYQRKLNAWKEKKKAFDKYVKTGKKPKKAAGGKGGGGGKATKKSKKSSKAASPEAGSDSDASGSGESSSDEGSASDGSASGASGSGEAGSDASGSDASDSEGSVESDSD